jgi:GPH family glycoside/pentoside/hexuronide:cation symporter
MYARLFLPGLEAMAQRRDRQPAPVPRVGRWRLLAYALPAAPLAALGLPLYAVVPTYYTETLGLPLAGVGFALLLVRIFDAVSDPLVGLAADRYRPGFGRRRFLFSLSLPIAALAALMLYWPPLGVTLLWLGTWGVVLSLGYTMALVPYSAWGAELVDDYRGRTSLTSLREGISLIGVLVAIVVPFAIGMERGAAVSGLAVLGIVVAISLPLLGAFAVAVVPEPREHTVANIPTRESLRFLGANKPFIRLLVAYFINGFANGIPATLFLYFVSDRLGLPQSRGPLLFLYFLFGIAGVPLAAITAKRFGKHRAWCLAMIVACAAFAFAPLLSNGSLYGFGAICVLTGLMLGFDLSIPPAIQADVIDVDTASSGAQRGGLYFAAWGLATKLSLAAGVGLVFPLLSAFGFDAAVGSGNQPKALWALAVAYAWIPIALKLVAVALMWNFPLDETAHRALRAEIDRR